MINDLDKTSSDPLNSVKCDSDSVHNNIIDQFEKEFDIPLDLDHMSSSISPTESSVHNLPTDTYPIEAPKANEIQESDSSSEQDSLLKMTNDHYLLNSSFEITVETHSSPPSEQSSSDDESRQIPINSIKRINEALVINGNVKEETIKRITEALVINDNVKEENITDVISDSHIITNGSCLETISNTNSDIIPEITISNQTENHIQPTVKESLILDSIISIYKEPVNVNSEDLIAIDSRFEESNCNDERALVNQISLTQPLPVNPIQQYVTSLGNFVTETQVRLQSINYSNIEFSV